MALHDTPAIDEALKRFRKKNGLSQSEAAEALGLPFRTLQDYEQGRRSPRGQFAKHALLSAVQTFQPK